jgi:large subunit ribosomal protein L15
MRLHTLKSRPGAKHRVKRLGCGESSGHGKTSGKGHKGQKARSGGSIRLGFEGGQMPLIRRIPKRGFNNANFKTKFAVVNVGALNRFEAGSTVDEGSLLSLGMIRRPYDAIKILGVGKLSTKLNVVANGASLSARSAIENAGGTLVIQ